MNSSFGTSGFGSQGFGGRGFGGSQGFNLNDLGSLGAGVWEKVEQVLSSFEQRPSGGSRMSRGDVRTAVLTLLAERPMHGYQIIQEIDARSGGSWKPSAGSVYPTLQLLADEGLIVAEEAGGRKTYSLTDAGRLAAESSTGTSAPWESTPKESGRATALPKAGVELAQAAAQVGRTGTPQQVQQAVDVLDEARRKLYALLAQG
ncbi:PadR family transcriptional regulator [Microbacterium sp. EYE_5]|uniref:PadR family transcriptional regulator n=1 Tax=unclassified Microbacterium TaxID=2609290 RepID=UPI002005612C|nr:MULTISPECIES: PadR family transcriptional regulator [unclassified Microbacterium]MCK6080225.1 PadR family transcriptional regulator [Microbacterium sp. EYE_382]MCK6085496.1 PadR family transcriptional regulator [Microbacterium sp. EYE_384]MCK6122279.1 PadR family transcriptional regulator [Microbacterium sp. EYE_80]MCK6126259.1 PadR family transcriptional regulator [Microbacterium sp. EYE_79]MCK6141180.1 PadR family transcriptional regulator [Microbacterium sp. EYE_39]